MGSEQFIQVIAHGMALAVCLVCFGPRLLLRAFQIISQFSQDDGRSCGRGSRDPHGAA